MENFRVFRNLTPRAETVVTVCSASPNCERKGLIRQKRGRGRFLSSRLYSVVEALEGLQLHSAGDSIYRQEDGDAPTKSQKHETSHGLSRVVSHIT